MSVFAKVLLPEPFGPIRAWISPLRTSRLRPLRISLPSTATWRSLTTSSGFVLMRFAFPILPHPRRHSRARGAAWRSGGEAFPAGAAVAHVRIAELESRPHQPGPEIDLGSAEQH